MLVTLLAAAAMLAPATSKPAVAPNSCTDDNHSKLDFWVGDWTVSDTRSGVEIAKSHVEKILGGCAVKETFEQTVGPGGRAIDYKGTSYSAFNNGDGTWRQFYVDSSGAALSYSGKAIENGVELEAYADTLGTRMKMSRQSDGTVRQTGEVTHDRGATWSPGHDFTYRKR